MAESGSGEPEDRGDSWQLRLLDYGIGILIALILTPVLGFLILLAVSGTFRDWVLE